MASGRKVNGQSEQLSVSTHEHLNDKYRFVSHRSPDKTSASSLHNICKITLSRERRYFTEAQFILYRNVFALL